MDINELWKLVNVKVERQKTEKEELTKYKKNWERLKTLCPAPGKILSPSEIKELFEKIWEVLL